MRIPPLDGFEWRTVERRDPNQGQPPNPTAGNTSGKHPGKRPQDFHDHFRERQATPEFWQEFREEHRALLEERGLLGQVEAWAKTGRPPEDAELVDPRGVEYGLHHMLPGALSGKQENGEINQAKRVVPIPADAHNAFDSALYGPVARHLKPGETARVPIPKDAQAASRFAEALHEEIQGEAQKLLPMTREEVRRHKEFRRASPEAIEEKARREASATAGKQAAAEIGVRELPKVAHENPQHRELAREAREAGRDLAKRKAEIGRRFWKLTGKEWHLHPGVESFLGKAGALVRGIFGRGLSIEAGVASLGEAREALDEARQGKFAEVARDGVKAAGSAAYALAPAMAFFRTPGMMLAKRLPVIGAVAGFAEAGYDAYQALRRGLSGERGEAGFWAGQALWRGAGAAGNLALSGMGPLGWAGAFGASYLAERQAQGIESARRLRTAEERSAVSLPRFHGEPFPMGEGRSRERPREEPAEAQTKGKEPERQTIGLASESRNSVGLAESRETAPLSEFLGRGFSGRALGPTEPASVKVNVWDANGRSIPLALSRSRFEAIEREVDEDLAEQRKSWEFQGNPEALEVRAMIVRNSLYKDERKRQRGELFATVNRPPTQNQGRRPTSRGPER